jgi:3-dehydroquinate dehydratase-1
MIDIEWESNIDVETHKRIIENAHRHSLGITAIFTYSGFNFSIL